MNIQDFFSNNECPFCHKKMEIFFASKRRQKTAIHDNILYSTFHVNRLIKDRYIFQYIFNLDDESFSINYYDQAFNNFDIITLDMIEKFKDFNTNIAHNFTIECMHCKNYSKHSHIFNLNFKTSKIEEFDISHEKYYFDKPCGKVLVTTLIPEKLTRLIVNNNSIVVPILENMTTDEMSKKIDIILLFS